VRELQSISASADGLRIGAAVSLNDAYAALSQHYPQLAELWERFASVPIRNAGTLGGNIANGSPIGDSMPWLIAVGAEVVLRSADAARQIPLEDLYLGYMQQSRQPEEIIEAVLVPLPADKLRFRTWKVCKRYDSDISAVCAAFAIWLDDGVITRARVAFGGMAATPKRAAACEAALIGQPWSQATAEQAMAALAGDYAPLSDMRASAEYRQRVARNLLQRFYLETGAAAESETRTRAFFLQEQPA
jgi:xanthine dehydrogenase small subunit